MNKKEFAVIGLGRFGGSVCEELSRKGMDVLAIDRNEDLVNAYAKIASHAVIAEATDESVLKNLGIRNFDHVVIAIGEDVKSSILITLILKELGVENITVKAKDEYHEKVLAKIGANNIIHPERDMGIRIANKISSGGFLDYLEISDKYSIIEVVANKKLTGKTISQLDIRANFGINIIAIKKNSEIIVSIIPDYIINIGDLLLIIGSDQNLEKFEKKFSL